MAAKVIGQLCMHTLKVLMTPNRRRKKGIESFMKIDTKPMTASAFPISFGCKGMPTSRYRYY